MARAGRDATWTGLFLSWRWDNRRTITITQDAPGISASYCRPQTQHPPSDGCSTPWLGDGQPRLLDQVRDRIRRKHYNTASRQSRPGSNVGTPATWGRADSKESAPVRSPAVLRRRRSHAVPAPSASTITAVRNDQTGDMTFECARRRRVLRLWFGLSRAPVHAWIYTYRGRDVSRCHGDIAVLQ